MRYLGSPPEKQAALEEKKLGGYKALDVMEQHLGQHEYFAGNVFTIADIALYAYTHVADEGGFDLADYPAVRAWLARIEARDKFVPMRAPDRN